jgi:hypothetical protein
VSNVDPVWLDLSRQPGKPQPFAVKGISAEEPIVTIINQAVGITNLRIAADDGVNVKQIEVAGLGDGETRSVNIASILPSAGDVTVTLIPLGRPSGTGGPGTAAAAPSGQALVVFAPFAVTPANQ